MPAADLVAWGLPRLSQLLPLDEESLTQIITYSASLSKEACAEHLKNLLGDSPAALEFITSFNSRLGSSGATTSRTQSPAQSGRASPATDGNGGSRRPNNEDKNRQKKSKRTKAPLHSAGPPRRPENYGNVTGGYMKSEREEEYMSAAPLRKGGNKGTSTGASVSNAVQLSEEPAALQVPQTTTTSASPHGSSATSSRNPSPARNNKSSGKAPPSAQGPLISDYLPNVKSKAAKSSSRHTGSGSGTSTPSKQSVTTANIADLTAAIAALEVSTNPTLGKDRQKCNCNATLHPLFTPAPNCLNCGKIICSLEGLQPCSFCGTPLLSMDEVQSMIKELRAERGSEKMRAHNESLRHDRGPSPSPSPSSSSAAYSNSTLDAAKAHRDKLLAFQAQNAQRTRVVDEAADFETPNVGSTQWMSPAQRALALKKQQRILREMEEKARPEWEKKKTIMSLDIKGGRVVRTYQSAAADSDAAKDDDTEADEEAFAAAAADEEQRNKNTDRSAFGRNPLLAAGGLVRPVWKAPEDVRGGAHRERKETWRRVQDDNDDNEQWILDGGLHGYGTEPSAV